MQSGGIRTSYVMGWIAFCLGWNSVFSSLSSGAPTSSAVFRSEDRSVRIEVEEDSLLHIEYSKNEGSLGPSIFKSPMIFKTDYSGPVHFEKDENLIETQDVRLTVLFPSLCIDLFDRVRRVDLGQICVDQFDQETKRLLFKPNELKQIYGMSNAFYDSTTADGDWSGRDWKGTGFGNVRTPFLGGAPSMSQFPLFYALGEGTRNLGVLIDTVYRMSWNFRDPKNWTFQMWGDQVRFYLAFGSDLKTLRKTFMNLLGKPPVPPKNLFGLWVSKFGYRGWDEIRAEIDSLRENHFPVDGFALDIQWFGGKFQEQNSGLMGSLRFDLEAFPHPEKEIARLRNQDGISLMTIEESYVDARLTEEFQSLVGNSTEDCLVARVSSGSCDPVRLGESYRPLWWGYGGMLDWTNPAAGKFWHNEKRLYLSRLGIFHHWTDLGEPEMFNPDAFYYGSELGKDRHADVHNLYSFHWVKSIFDGYQDRENQNLLRSELNLEAPPRHFSMSRAGAPGMQRFGAGLWSGDIGRNPGSLRAHLNSQMHLSLSGIDYYNSDVGGFMDTPEVSQEPRSHSLLSHLSYEDELYTQWFANSALGEIPLRPHGWAYHSPTLSFSPQRRGESDSNRANLLLRYEIFPYLYSLAHRAYLWGEAIFPPLVYHFQSDPRVRALGNVKMIGDSLLYGVVVGMGQKERTVYLPQGGWFNYHTEQHYRSHGEETEPLSLFIERGQGKPVFTLPLFARDGAIIPVQLEPGRNIQTGSDALQFKIFEGSAPSQFTLYDDDGLTLAYQSGQVLTTLVRRSHEAKGERIRIEATSGKGMSDKPIRIQLITAQHLASAVSMDGVALPRCGTQDEVPEHALGCWKNATKSRVEIKALPRSRKIPTEFFVEM